MSVTTKSLSTPDGVLKPGITLVDVRMAEWHMPEQPRRIQQSVRRVLSELSVTSLLMLKDPRLEVMVPGKEPYNAWAYFPVGRRGPAHMLDPKKYALVLKSFLDRTPWPRRLSENKKLFLATDDYYAHASLWRRLVAYDHSPKPETRVLLMLSITEKNRRPLKIVFRTPWGTPCSTCETLRRGTTATLRGRDGARTEVRILRVFE